MFDVAIVGNGASAIATLKTVIALTEMKNETIKICMIGNISNMGYGFVYNEDNDCAIMNTPASNISIDFEDGLDFVKWSHKNGYSYDNHSNIPRRVYGKYLQDTAMELNVKNKVTFIDAHATDIIKIDDKYQMINTASNGIIAEHIILCAGAANMNDYYNLSGLNSYISNPYPLHRQLSQIKKDDHVMILGSGLTAVDISAYLHFHQHRGKISICSREGKFPVVKSRVNSYLPKWCRFDNFLKIYEAQGSPLTLRQILRLVRRELKTVDANWKNVFFPVSQDSETVFTEKVKSAQKGIAWLDILIGIQHEIDQTWAYVKSEHKAFFIKKYLSDVLRAIAPIPLQNAQILCRLFSNKQLSISGGISAIQHNNNGFVIYSENKSPLKVDCIVNATGFNRHISIRDDNFLANLVKNEFVKLHSSGGIQVCALTGKVKTNENIYSVGFLTSGEHPLINNIEFIVMNAKATAMSVVNSIIHKKILNNESKTACSF